MIQKPPNYQLMRYKLESQQWEQDELSELAGLLISGARWGCVDYYLKIVNEVERENIIGNLQSDYIYYQINFLLECGLDPNHYFALDKELCLPLELAVHI